MDAGRNFAEAELKPFVLNSTDLKQQQTSHLCQLHMNSTEDEENCLLEEMSGLPGLQLYGKFWTKAVVGKSEWAGSLFWAKSGVTDRPISDKKHTDNQ